MSEKTLNPTVRHVARVTLQLKTPLHLGSGRPGEFSDAGLVYDANGLPAIPGSSIAGVLRSLYGKESPEANTIFGYQKCDRDTRGSRLTVSWACLHDSKDKPVEGLADPPRVSDDEILRLARQPSLRDHVRITHTGVADAEGHGKFDEVSLQIGHRFTFEMELRGPGGDRDADSKRLEDLIEKLRDPAFRLGGKTRRGFGAVELKWVDIGSFDLADEKERRLYLDHPVSLADRSEVLEEYPLNATQAGGAFATLQLKPRGFWMFGGGVDVQLDGHDEHWRAADMAPARDTVVTWDSGNRAECLPDCLIIPGSSIKGALAHRTAFHYNCLAGRFIDPDAPDAKDQLEGYAENNPAVDELFGSAKDDESGKRGHVIIDDSYLRAETPTRRVPHVSIDRFTGGALDGALFDERPVVGGELNFSVHLDCPSEDLDPIAIEALRRGLADLAEGRLALGAGVGRGNGFFEGTIDCSVAAPEKATAGLFHSPPPIA